MSNINIKRFVDINIVKHEVSTVNSIRDTVILLSTEGVSEAVAAVAGTPLAANAPGEEGVQYYTRAAKPEGSSAGYLNDGTYVYTPVDEIPAEHAANTYYPLTTVGSDASVKASKVYSSLAEFERTESTTNLPLTYAYVKMFFNNNGNKVKVIYGVSSSTIADEIDALPYEHIVVAYTGAYADIKAAAQNRQATASVSDVNFAHNNTGTYGINQKILLGRTESENDTDKVALFGVKVSSQTGAEMTIAAYLSNIAIYGSNSVQDYQFTKENITPEENDDAVLGSVLDNNMNVDMYVANGVRNLGGNLKDGADLVNTFVLIVLHQTLTDRVLNLLSTKIKGEAGLAAVQTVMSEELTRYVANGYLTTDEVWTDNDLTVSYNGQTYTIISQDTPLTLGYYITILPLASLSAEDKAARKTPPIYVIISDSYGIRKVTINGEVI